MQKQAGSLSNYLQKVLHVTGTCSRLSLQYRGEQAFSNLEKIIEISRSLEQSNVHTLRQYIEWLKEKSDAGKEESESILSERDTRALQLITIHRSKGGLEFNMVILVNLFSGGQAGGRERFVADRLGGRFEMRGGGLRVSPPMVLMSWLRRRKTVWKRRNGGSSMWRPPGHVIISSSH